MKAGRGIIHSEHTRPALRKTGQKLFGLQTWVALPLHAEESEPDFIHIAADDLPTFDSEDAKGRLIAESAFSLSSPLKTASDTLYCGLYLDAGHKLHIDADAEECALYTVEGTRNIDDSSFEPGQLVILKPSMPCTVGARAHARFVIIGGAMMKGPRYLWGNFVSSRPERIGQAQEDWKMRRLAAIPGDSAKYIPLPDENKKTQKAVGGAAFS